MIDRKLLELAAKAIGATEYGGPDDCRPPGVVLLLGEPIHYEGAGEFGYEWDPSADDGDCARMEAALLIDVEWHEDRVECDARHTMFTQVAYFDEHGDDRDAARRTASLQVAAEIGKEMP